MKNIRFFLEFTVMFFSYKILRLLPHFLVKFNARIIGYCIFLWPSARKVACANIMAAFPEKNVAEIRFIARESFFNVIFNMLEFLWMSGNVRRIEKYTIIPEPTLTLLKKQVAENCRIIFVNPHLGSWEASGLMAPHYAGVNMVAIAKPVRNPYLNKVLNSLAREREKGLKIIYSKGAMRACLKSLKEGFGVGTLIDQNTRVRDGGTFVNFFGLPVSSSSAPAVLMDYCRKNNIPAIIIYGTSVRLPNGMITAHSELLSKKFEEYESHEEVLQELMNISERYVRRFPEHYLWLYKRFQNIPRDADDELRSKYPFYATIAPDKFYSKLKS